MATQYVTNTGVSSDQDAVVSHGGNFLRLMGYAARETAGSASDFNIVDGSTGSGGTMMVPVEIAANESKSEWFGPDGIEVETGNLSIDHTSGSLDITLYFAVA